MKLWRALIRAESASFRYHFLMREQPTLPLPPPSTILGLLSAAVGRWVGPSETRLAYRFQWQTRAKDLEKIHQYGETGTYEGSNILLREILWDVELLLYLDNPDLARYLKEPVYPLLLGRSDNLAFLKELSEVEVSVRRNTKGKLSHYSLVLFPNEEVPGQLLTLPVAMSNEAPRSPIGMKIFQVVEKDIEDVMVKEAIDDHELSVGLALFNFSDV